LFAVSNDLVADGITAGLSRAVVQAVGESSVGAVALDVSNGAAKLRAGDLDHVVNAHLTTCGNGGQVLGSNGCNESRDSDDELHVDGRRGNDVCVWAGGV
jgi:hypothetical protein